MSSITILLGDRVTEVPILDPTETVLQWLRRTGRVGTKEGCAEGDCGACTVVLGEPAPDGDGLRYRAVNACIRFLPTIAGMQLLTVEDLKGPDGSLHPVQQAMVETHASQCGFCTPGFVMSLFAQFHTDRRADRESLLDALSGNLCRCTGYRPILEAAQRMGDVAGRDRFADAAAETAARLRTLAHPADDIPINTDNGSHAAPRSLEALAALLMARPDAVLLAGGTDVGLWVTKQHRRLGAVIHVGAVPELVRITERDGVLEIGAAVTWTDALPVLARHWPSFAGMVRRFASVPIRNSATVGGNIANGSPIGDGMPAFIALGAELVLHRDGHRRRLPIEDFYLGYRRTALEPGAFVEAVRVPLPAPDLRFAAYKVSKRFDQDISAVCACFALRLDGEGRVAAIRAGFGGVAAIPARARGLEAAIMGKPWTTETIAAGQAALDAEFAPIDDMRASARYRRAVTRNLLTRFFLETKTEGAVDMPVTVSSHG